MDEELHVERLSADRGKRTFGARRADVPSGAFVRYEGEAAAGRQWPYLVLGHHLLAWSPAGYTALVMPSAIAEQVEVLTPPSIVAVLSAGYRLRLHPSATTLLG
jgi:hypothetical protein